jgi:predicted acetyltransferase
VLENLGQLYRHDLSEAYGHLPNPDGTFNNRRLDLFLAGAEPARRTWLITAAGAVGGFVMTSPAAVGGGTSICDFFVVRALRRTGVGREAARQAIAGTPGRGASRSRPITLARSDSGPWSPPTSRAAPGPPTTTRR